MNNNVKDTSRFFEMDRTPSQVFPELTQLQEYIIKEMAKGRTISSIAKELGVHFTTISRRTKSLAFVNSLHEVNSAKADITQEVCRQRLMQIVRTSQSDSAVIRAIQVLLTSFKSITLDELAEVVADEENSQAKARQILKDLGLSDDEEE